MPLPLLWERARLLERARRAAFGWWRRARRRGWQVEAGQLARRCCWPPITIISPPRASCSPHPTPPPPHPPTPQEDLFRQAMASRLPRYRAILAALQLAPAAQRGGPPRVPLRLYLRTTAPGGYLASYEGIAATSRPVAALGAGGEPVSLRQALLPLLEEALLRCGGNGRGGADAAGSAAATGGAQSQPSTPSSATAAAAAAAAAAKGGDAGGGISPSPSADAELPAAPSAEASGSGAAEAAPNDGAGSSSTAAAEQPAAAGVPEAAVDAAADGAAAAGTAPSQATALLEAAAAAGRVLVGGTSPPLDAPLAWLHTNLHAPDYFLYVVAHVPLPC